MHSEPITDLNERAKNIKTVQREHKSKILRFGVRQRIIRYKTKD